MFKYCKFFGIMSRKIVNVLYFRADGVRTCFTRVPSTPDKNQGWHGFYARLMRHEGA